MSDFIERMEAERLDLRKRIDTLLTFFVSPQFNALDDTHRMLLRQQAVVMGQYRDILAKRLELLNVQ